MCNRRTCISVKVLAFVLSIVLFIALTGISLLLEADSAIPFCGAQESAFPSDTTQKLCVKGITKVEILDDFEEVLEEDLCCDQEESIPSRISIHLFHLFFLCLLSIGLFHAITRNFLDISICNCILNTVIISYIHRSDGKIKY